MTIYKKALTITIIIFMAITMLGINSISINKSLPMLNQQPVKVSLFSRNLNDDYIASVCKYLEDIQKNEGKVEITYHDAKFDQSVQNKEIDKALNEGTDLIFLDIADTVATQEVINKIKQYNIPVIMFNREPLTVEPIKSYNKALFVGWNSQQAGTLQGQMLVNTWNNNKEFIDRNKNNIMQYIILIGEKNNKVPIERTSYCLSTIQDAGIRIEEIASKICNWDTGVAKSAIEALFLRYDGNIDVIISNDDSMAIGAIEALQEYGYNIGDKAKTIPVVGIDAVPEARELISKGMMLGSVVFNNNDTAEALYKVGMNLVNYKNPLDGTQYKFDDTGVVIRLPYEGYIENSK